MVENNKIVIVTEAPILEPLVKGGAQRVFFDTYRALILYCESCIVFHYNSSSFENSDVFKCSLLSPRGNLQYQFISKKCLLETLSNAWLIISIDKYFPKLPKAKNNILSLSNLAYANERDAIKNNNWDRVWVVSTYLRDILLQEFEIEKNIIDIIPPTLVSMTRKRFEHISKIEKQLRKDGVPMKRRILFPHRSDPEKGLKSVIDLLRILIKDDERWKLILTSPGAHDDMKNKKFFTEVVHFSRDVKKNLLIIPWQPYKAMSHLFRISGCTIFASTLPESFGLSAAESIVCTTPVITLESGALSKKYIFQPKNYNFVSEIPTIETADLVRNICGTRISQSIAKLMIHKFSFINHVQSVHTSLNHLYTGHHNENN